MITEAGIEGMETCAQKAAELTDFDTGVAQEIILELLAKFGPQTGEVLVWKCRELGLTPHDDRAFGSAFAGLSRSGLIKKLGYGPRHRGHGTSGAIVWILA